MHSWTGCLADRPGSAEPNPAALQPSARIASLPAPGHRSARVEAHRAFATGFASPRPEVDLGRRQAEAAQDRAHLAAVVGAVMDDLRQSEAQRRVHLPAVVELHDVLVGIEIARQELRPGDPVAGHR